MIILTRITDHEIIDIIPYNDGFIFSSKIPLPGKKFKITYSAYDFHSQSIQPVTKSAYLLRKFGASYQAIAEQLGNTVACDAGLLYDKRLLVLYPSGEAGIFAKDGELCWSGDYFYHDCPVRSIAVQGKYFWCAVPDNNCVIRYNAHNMKVSLRIGSETTTTFGAPEHISYADGTLYVSCYTTGKVKTISTTDYSVKEYIRFNEPVQQFFIHNGYQIACLESGIYLV